jgi:hypothetical protein
VVAFVVLCLAALIVAVVCIVLRKKEHDENWEISYDELEIGEHLGTGGTGAVHRAAWKGTEVAVKVLASEKVTKDMERSFKDEVIPSTPSFPFVNIAQSAELRARQTSGPSDDSIATS